MSEQQTIDPSELHEIHRAPERPNTLYRAFAIHPELLSLDLLHQTLKPGKHAADDPSRVGDGNELGVYMSTNEKMVDHVYTTGELVDNYVPTPKHVDSRGVQIDCLQLPACGVVVKVDTVNLEIREPKMTPALEGHYNNGYEGYEWVADEISPDAYQVVRLVLADHPNDRRRLVIDVAGMDEEQLQQAIDQIKEEYEKRKVQAEEYRDFLLSIDPSQRLNDFYLKIKWREYQNKQTQN